MLELEKLGQAVSAFSLIHLGLELLSLIVERAQTRSLLLAKYLVFNIVSTVARIRHCSRVTLKQGVLIISHLPEEFVLSDDLELCQTYFLLAFSFFALFFLLLFDCARLGSMGLDCSLFGF